MWVRGGNRGGAGRTHEEERRGVAEVGLVETAVAELAVGR